MSARYPLVVSKFTYLFGCRFELTMELVHARSDYWAAATIRCTAPVPTPTSRSILINPICPCRSWAIRAAW